VILVDSSVWIDYFRGTATDEAALLDDLLDKEELMVGDLMLTEVLQGFRQDSEYRRAQRLMLSLQIVDLAGQHIAVKAAQNYRLLRNVGITIRKTIDAIIATHCIENGVQLLHSDRDFEPFVKYLGLTTPSASGHPSYRT
jgi:predicted nucleic acid-binding protein